MLFQAIHVPGGHPPLARDVLNLPELARDVSDGSDTVKETLEHCARYRDDFDLAYAFELGERFGLDPKMSLSAFSLGIRSAVNAIEGLASVAALKLFDEVHHGMDGPLPPMTESSGRCALLSA